jgi:hypothetical protein
MKQKQKRMQKFRIEKLFILTEIVIKDNGNQIRLMEKGCINQLMG